MTSSLPPSVEALVQQTLLGEAADRLDVGLIAWNDTGAYLAANECACRLTGYTREQLLSLGVGGLIGDGVAALRDLDERRLLRGTTTITTADGTRLDVDWLTIPTRVANMPAMASLFWPSGSFD